jgi:hypothetical protein
MQTKIINFGLIKVKISHFHRLPSRFGILQLPTVQANRGTTISAACKCEMPLQHIHSLSQIEFPSLTTYLVQFKLQHISRSSFLIAISFGVSV